MGRYFLSRLALAVPALFLVITAAFFMMRAAPGGPFDQERILTEDVRRNLNELYHLDDPLWKQYLFYLSNLARGDFGPSFRYRDFTVNDLIYGGLPASFTVGGLALVISVLIGSGLGAVAALRQNSWVDYSVMGLGMTGIAIPNFVLAPILTLILGVGLSVLPVAGWGEPRHLVLPVISLALPQVAYIARLMRGSMIEVLNSNYVRTARAKGLDEQTVIFRHALKAAILPVVSYLGPATAGLITGSVVIESIYDIPGIGRYFIHGALNRDYTLVMGVVVFYAVLIIILNLLVDLVYGFLDPKIRLQD